MTDPLREALERLYDLPTHRHPAPNGADMPQDCVMLRDVEMLHEDALRAALASPEPAAPFDRERPALAKAARDMVWTLYDRCQHDNEGHDLIGIERYLVRRWQRLAAEYARARPSVPDDYGTRPAATARPSEHASEYGRLLAERDRLVAAGADPDELLVPDLPDGEARP